MENIIEIEINGILYQFPKGSRAYKKFLSFWASFDYWCAAHGKAPVEQDIAKLDKERGAYSKKIDGLLQQCNRLKQKWCSKVWGDNFYPRDSLPFARALAWTDADKIIYMNDNLEYYRLIAEINQLRHERDMLDQTHTQKQRQIVRIKVVRI